MKSMMNTMIRSLRRTLGLRPARPAIILHRYKAIYVPIPKVACSSWKLLCLDLLELGPPSLGIHLTRFPEIPKRRLVSFPDYFKFAFVRNPWDRLVSCYANKIAGDASRTDEWYVNGVFRSFLSYRLFHGTMSFTEFVEAIIQIPDAKAEAHFRSQYTFLTDWRGRVLVDYIGKLEEAPDSFAHVLHRLGIGDRTVPHQNQARHDRYVSCYTPRTRELVRQRYRWDIDLLQYEFGSPSSWEASA